MSLLFQWMGFLYWKRKETLNIEFWVVSTEAVKIWDHLNENCLVYWLMK